MSMDASHFDAMSRSLGADASRRGLLGGVLATLSLGGRSRAKSTAKTRHQGTKRKKLQRNQFGCVNVGGKCRGKASNCCSGICQGKKPKRGERDKSRCVGHDAATCLPGQTACDGTGGFVPCTTSAGEAGDCYTTTGNAAYCSTSTACVSCRTDVDCRPFCGPQAACTPCAVGCEQTGGTACSGIGDCVFPP
jgi:hypothetical protein